MSAADCQALSENDPNGAYDDDYSFGFSPPSEPGCYRLVGFGTKYIYVAPDSPIYPIYPSIQEGGPFVC